MKYVLFILISFGAHATDWGKNEGRILNSSSYSYYCYKDVVGSDCVQATVVEPGETCIGDALGGETDVYKVPNRSSFYCDNSICEAEDFRSSTIMALARMKNGFDKYGTMSVEHFSKIMGKGCFTYPDRVVLTRNSSCD